MLRLLLQIGNFLNQGAKKPQVLSFNLDFFGKISLTKGVGNYSKSTLMEYLVLTLFDSQILSFASKLQKTEAATKIDITTVQQKLKEFLIGSELLNSELVQI